MTIARRWLVMAGMCLVCFLLGATPTVTSLGETRVEFEVVDQAVPTSLGSVLELPLTTWPCDVCAEVVNSHASVALTEFALQAKDHVNGEWYTVLSGADWADSTITKLELATNNATNPLPNTLAAGSKSHVWLHVKPPCYGLRFAATAATAGTVTIRGTMAAR